MSQTQAYRIIERFGGVRALAQVIGRNPSSIYRWLYPKEKGGTGGFIPTADIPVIQKAARVEGIYLTADDLYPGDMRQKKDRHGNVLF